MPSLMPPPAVKLPLLRAAVAAVMVVALAAVQPAAALSPAATVRALSAGLRPAGGASGAYVVDLDSGETVFSTRAGTRRMPASVEKLFTTSTALLRLGAEFHLSTEVAAVEPLELDGTLRGNVYLRGGGDPTLTSDDLALLAQDLIDKTGLSRITGHVVGDESAFDARRGVPSAGYAISVDVQPLGALMVDRGRTGRARPYYQADPAAWAASAFARQLRRAGVEVA